jgi:ferredoxin-NADP reductase
MLAMTPGSEIIAAQIAGDFTLPERRDSKYVFIAGGIGITPFRSMIKYMLDTNQHRNITLLYSNRTADELVYQDVFDQAQKKLRANIIYTLTDKRRIPPGWNGAIGHIDAKMIRERVQDYQHSIYYISGPNIMVESVRDVLLEMGISRANIHVDFFPGLA